MVQQRAGDARWRDYWTLVLRMRRPPCTVLVGAGVSYPRDGPRGLQEEARLLEDTGALGRGTPGGRVLVLHPEARGDAAPLRLPAGARRRPAELGRAEGSLARPARQAPRHARRGSPGRLRLVRGRDPGRR